MGAFVLFLSEFVIAVLKYSRIINLFIVKKGIRLGYFKTLFSFLNFIKQIMVNVALIQENIDSSSLISNVTSVQKKRMHIVKTIANAMSQIVLNNGFLLI